MNSNNAVSTVVTAVAPCDFSFSFKSFDKNTGDSSRHSNRDINRNVDDRSSLSLYNQTDIMAIDNSIASDYTIYNNARNRHNESEQLSVVWSDGAVSFTSI